MAGHVALFQLHAADAVLEAPLRTYSRNIDLENGRSFLLRVFKEENFATRTFLVLSGGMAESAECGSAMYLRARRGPFTKKLKPAVDRGGKG